MCVSPIKVKSKNPYNVSRTFVPCGLCRECRRSKRMQWQSRLFSEVDEFHARRGWNVGFLTLTYQGPFLPHIPRKFFKEGEYEKIPCFSYDDIRRFVNCLRNYFLRSENLRSAFRFFLTCEYGDKKHRPHYHGIFLFRPSISHEKMYKLIEDAWCGSSQYIPQPRSKRLERKPLGTINSFADFVPRDVHACGAYAAKYVCKDLEFEDVICGKFDHLSRKALNHLRHFLPFHKQSIGFGSPLIKDKSFADLADFYENGFDSYGQPKKYSLGSYLNEKLLFVNRKKYNLRAHRFETVKCYSQFFAENVDLVWKCRFERARRMFQMYDDKGYWESHFDDFWQTQSDTYLHCFENVHNLIDLVGLDDLSYFYATYYGIDRSHCHIGLPAPDIYFSRYDPCADLSSYPLIDVAYYSQMTSVIDYIFGYYRRMEKTEKRTVLEALYDKIRSFFNS